MVVLCELINETVFDNPGVKLSHYFNEFFKFIEDARARGDTVLVQCVCGTSRRYSFLLVLLISDHYIQISFLGLSCFLDSLFCLFSYIAVQLLLLLIWCLSTVWVILTHSRMSWKEERWYISTLTSNYNSRSLRNRFKVNCFLFVCFKFMIIA